MLIEDEIRFYLPKYVDRVIVTGMDGSGKSTLISKLSPEFETLRINNASKSLITPQIMKYYQLFDRFSILDSYAYEDINWQGGNYVRLQFIKETLEKYFDKSMFVFMLNNCYVKQTRQPKVVIQKQKQIYCRFLQLIDFFPEVDIDMVVLVSDVTYFRKFEFKKRIV